MAITAINDAAANASATSVTTTGVDMSGANFFAVFVTMDNGTFAATPVQDSEGNTYEAVATSEGSSGRTLHCYFAKAATAGSSQTFTANRTTSGGITIAATGWSGVHATAPFDQEVGDANVFQTTFAGGSLTPSEDNCLVLSCCYHGQASATENDATMTIIVNHDGGNEESIAVTYVVQSTAAAVNPTWSGGAESIYMGVMNVSFKAGAAAVIPPMDFTPTAGLRPSPFKPCGEAFRPEAFKGWH